MEVKKIIYVGELIRTPNAPDHMGIIQGFQWLGLDYLIVDPILDPPREVVRKCNDFGADLIIHGNTDSFSLGIIPKIKGKQVFFMGDFRPSIEHYESWDKWIQNSKGLSYILLSNKDQLKMWEQAFGVPTGFWPHGCYVPEKLEFDKNFEYDLVFIGSIHESPPLEKRPELINQIKHLSPINFTHITAYDTEGRNKIWKDMPKIYHSSRFVLDISHFWDVEGYASGRYWYSAGLGGCSLTKRFPGCEEFYQDKKHKLYFDTPEECIDLIKYYLDKPEKRNKIKAMAFEHNKRNHNYAIRFRQMFSIL